MITVIKEIKCICVKNILENVSKWNKKTQITTGGLKVAYSKRSKTGKPNKNWVTTKAGIRLVKIRPEPWHMILQRGSMMNNPKYEVM